MAMCDNDFETRKNETNFLLSQSRKKDDRSRSIHCV